MPRTSYALTMVERSTGIEPTGPQCGDLAESERWRDDAQMPATTGRGRMVRDVVGRQRGRVDPCRLAHRVSQRLEVVHVRDRCREFALVPHDLPATRHGQA